jgi:hypothetical protein
MGPALQSTAGMLTERRPLQREALSLRTSDRVTGVAIRYPPPPSAREVSARSGDGGRDSTHPTAGHMGPALQGTAGMLTGRRTLQREALSLRTSDRVTGAAIRYPPPPSAREVSARSGDGGRDSAHPTAGHIGPALQSTAGMLTGRRPLQREALSLRTSDRVTGVAIRYPPPPSAREVSARSGDGGRDSAHPRAGHMGPALQSTAGMLTGRRLLQREAVTEGETAHIPRRDTWVPPYRARRVC